MVYVVAALVVLVILLGCAVVAVHVRGRSNFLALIDSDEDNTKLQYEYAELSADREEVRKRAIALADAIAKRDKDLLQCREMTQGLTNANMSLRDRIDRLSSPDKSPQAERGSAIVKEIMARAREEYRLGGMEGVTREIALTDKQMADIGLCFGMTDDPVQWINSDLGEIRLTRT